MSKPWFRRGAALVCAAVLLLAGCVACGKSGDTVRVRLCEVTHSIFYAPQYAALALGYFEEEGLEVELSNGQGADAVMAAVLSGNIDIGFAGPGVIKETTGMDIPPKYHRSYRALSRGHIQGIWDRRQIRANLKQALLTMGGRNLYYR